MIATINNKKLRLPAKAITKRFEQFEIGQSISRSLQEQHRQFDLEKMIGPIRRRLSGGV